jgi:predicted nucleic acid-binding protein
MGLILDSSVVIAAERRGDTVEQLIEKIMKATGDQEAALSAICLTELIHGLYRFVSFMVGDADALYEFHRSQGVEVVERVGRTFSQEDLRLVELNARKCRRIAPRKGCRETYNNFF